MQRPLTLSTCASVAGTMLVMAGWCGVTLADGTAKPTSFAADARSRIDDNALWGPRERVNQAGLEATGSLMQWLVVHAALPADEELRRADDEFQQAQDKFKPGEAPVAAQKIYDDLIAALPARMRPAKRQAGIAVRQAFAAGVSATIGFTIGGAFDPARFRPLALEAQVRLFSDGKFRSESFGWPWDSGDTAVLQAGNITLVVGTRPVSLFDRSWFYANGQDPRHFDAVIVKSPHCEPQMFADWCAKRINVDAPGSTSANLRSLGHTQCARPIFPLDGAIEFHPEAQIFRRH